MIILIAAAAENNALGKDGKLLWHLPDDFRHFKDATSHHAIIMGRKTFETFPKLLPNRRHIVITRQKDYRPAGVAVAGSLAEAIASVPEDEDIYVIGGGEIYQQSLAVADMIDLTRVHAAFDADAFFPEIDPEIWELRGEAYHPKDERHDYDFTFRQYFRKSPK